MPSDRKLWAAGWGRCVRTMTIHSAHLTGDGFLKGFPTTAPQLEHSDPPGLGLTLPLPPVSLLDAVREESTPGRMGWWGGGERGGAVLVSVWPPWVGWARVCRGHCEQDVFALRRRWGWK